MSRFDPPYYLIDDDGNITPTSDVLAWGEMLEGKARIIGQVHFGPIFVSTVFLGIDHNWSGQGRPLLFETMIFNGDFGEPLKMWRYCTKAEALEGHATAVHYAKSLATPAATAATDVLAKIGVKP